MEFPSTIYKVNLNAEAIGAPSVVVTAIPCKATSKLYKTANGRNIKHEQIMQPQSVVDSHLLIEYVYCLDEASVQAATALLMGRARDKAIALLDRANALMEAVNREPTITHKTYADEGLKALHVLS